ncbi:MAG: hypothetical protein LUE27_07025 [Clostridia bacterium]|nr:hypothetical protein [Clostridia bacterium]
MDPHYKGDRTILSSFDAVRVDYPDTEMADRIAGLAAEEQQENLDIAYSCITL